MRDNLDDSLELMFGHEGGYVNRASDKGGPTKYGITHKTLAAWRGVPKVSAEEVRALTIDEAEQIYRKSYWQQAGGDVLPDGLDYAAFDFAVNSGPVQAVKTLQRVLGVEPDGWIGPATLRAITAYRGKVVLIEDYCEARMAFLRSLKNAKTGFPANGRGWSIRVTGIDPLGKYKPAPGVVGNARAMALKRKPEPVAMPFETQIEAKAKADPVASVTQALLKPEVLLSGGGMVATGAAPIIAGSNAMQYAISFGIVVVILVGAVYAVRRILKSQVA